MAHFGRPKTCHEWLNCHLLANIGTSGIQRPVCQLCHLWLRRHLLPIQRLACQLCHLWLRRHLLPFCHFWYILYFRFCHFWHVLVSTIYGTFQFLPLLAHFSFCHFWHILDCTIYGTSAYANCATCGSEGICFLSAICGTFYIFFQILPLFQFLPFMAHFSFCHFCHFIISAKLSQFIEHFLPFLAHFSFCHFWHILDSTIYGTSAISGSTIPAKFKLSWFTGIQHRTLSVI